MRDAALLIRVETVREKYSRSERISHLLVSFAALTDFAADTTAGKESTSTSLPHKRLPEGFRVSRALLL